MAICSSIRLVCFGLASAFVFRTFVIVIPDSPGLTFSTCP